MNWDTKRINEELNKKLAKLLYGDIEPAVVDAKVLVLSANEEIIFVDKFDEILYMFRWTTSGIENFYVKRLDKYPDLKKLYEVINVDILKELGIPKIKDSTVKVDVLDEKKFEKEIDKEIEMIWNETHNKKKKH